MCTWRPQGLIGQDTYKTSDQSTDYGIKLVRYQEFGKTNSFEYKSYRLRIPGTYIFLRIIFFLSAKTNIFLSATMNNSTFLYIILNTSYVKIILMEEHMNIGHVLAQSFFKV